MPVLSVAAEARPVDEALAAASEAPTAVAAAAASADGTPAKGPAAEPSPPAPPPPPPTPPSPEPGRSSSRRRLSLAALGATLVVAAGAAGLSLAPGDEPRADAAPPSKPKGPTLEQRLRTELASPRCAPGGS